MTSALLGTKMSKMIFDKTIICTENNGSKVQLRQGVDYFEYEGDLFQGNVYTSHGLLFYDGSKGSAVIIAYPNEIRITYKDGSKTYLDCNESDRFGPKINYITIDPEYIYDSWESVDKEIEKKKQDKIDRENTIEKCKQENPAWIIEKKCQPK